MVKREGTFVHLELEADDFLLGFNNNVCRAPCSLKNQRPLNVTIVKYINEL